MAGRTGADRLSSNFAFLRAEWPQLADEAGRAEFNAFGDPRAACFYVRRALELAVAWLYDAEPELREGSSFAQVVTYRTEYAQSVIDAFATPDKPPHIAISVDTGIDIPDVVNLVFFKLVRSKTKFWQMIGRGTRLRPDLYGPGQGKADFYLFDFCQNLEYFNQQLDAPSGSLAPSVAERIFAARIELMTGLDGRLPSESTDDGDGTTTEHGLRIDLAHSLHDEVSSMDLSNVLVRPHRQWVETYVDLDNWHGLSAAEAGDVIHHLAGLPPSTRDDDEQAKRFDLLMLRLQLAVLNAEPAYDRLRAQVQTIAAALLEQTNIPAVRSQQELLGAAAGDEWWDGVTLPLLELLRRRVRSLVKLIQKTERAVLYTDFEDQLGDATEMPLSGLVLPDEFERFRAKARVYLRAHEDDLALQKLRRNLPLTEVDLGELERMLTEAGVGTSADLARARQKADGLGLFVRSLVGLDRAAASEALSEFIAGRTLTASQLDFVHLVVAELTDRGVMEASRLYESPFTEIAPQGPESLFSDSDIDSLITILDRVRATAGPTNVVA